MNPNLNRRLKQSLYSLRKEYGDGPVSVYTAGEFETNIETGARTVTNEVTVLRRVIILPHTVSRDVVQSISQISANKAFVMGGTFDTRSTLFIFERPACPDLKNQDWIVYEGSKYEIKKIQEYGDIAYVVDSVELQGDVPEQIFPVANDHLIEFTSVAEGEVV